MIESPEQPRLNDVVFVYGTLRRYPGSQSSRLRPSRWIGNATIQGNLYLLGRYPGLVLSDRATDLVHGEVYQMLTPSKTLAQLDRYEGCGRSHGQPYAFRRVQQPVRLQTGEDLDAWVYVYLRGIQSSRRIGSGDFLVR